MFEQRVTYWLDDRQDVVQVAVGLYRDDELVVEVTEAVGPFELATEAVRRAALEADALRARQIPGQQPLWDPPGLSDGALA